MSNVPAAPSPRVVDRYRRAADRFSVAVDGVGADDEWDRPSPCEGWLARDVVGHLVGWVPALLGTSGLEMPEGPSADVDPAGAWHHLDRRLRALLDDPAQASTTLQVGPLGTMTVADAIDVTVTGDLVLHTWDLARATGQDERLDPELVHDLLDGMQTHDEALRASGHYGAKVPVPDDADEQTRLVAFSGRTP